MEDYRIIELYFRRSEMAIAETDKKYGHYCKSISFNILRNRLDVQECVNDTYFQTWNAIPPTKPHNLSAYLAKIIRNISLNRLKANFAQKRGAGKYYEAYDELAASISGTSTADEVFDAVHLKNCINQWLGSLTTEQRLVFIGRYWYFDSISDIASKMGFSESKTKMMLSRLRNNLKVHLEKEEIYL